MSHKELDDEKIGAYIDSRTYEAISWYTSKLSTERKNVLDYVNRKLPKPFFQNGSRWVSPICYNHLEFMRAQIGDTFSAGSGLVTLTPQHADDIEAARIGSEYINHVFFVQNNGERIIRDAIFDGLTARVAVAKVYWDHDYDFEVLEFENVTEEEFQAWIDDDDISDINYAQDGDGTYFGKLVKRNDKGQVRVEMIPPEEFAIEKTATGLSPEFFMCHRSARTVDWVVRNYPEMKGREDELRGAGDRADINLTPEFLARHEDTDNLYMRADGEIQDEMREVMLVEAYCQMRRKGDPTARLYKVLRCGSVTIEIEPVESIPFVCFTPLPRPHVFYGENYIKTLMPTQDMHTASYRLIADSAMLTATPRFLVEKGALVDPRQLLDTKLGGVVQVKNMAGVMPMPQPPMQPMLFNLVQGLEAQIEATSGISQASVGLNKDAVSSQNSSALYEQVTGMSMIRQKEIAREFAKQFLCQVFEKAYALIVRNEKRERIVELTGGWVTINPSEWALKRHAVAAAHLGYGERAQEAQKILQFAAALKNQGGDVFTGFDGMYNMLSDAMTLEGHRRDIPRYLPITPDKVQPPGPSPKEQAEMAQMQADAEATMLNAKANLKKVEDHTALSEMKTRLAAIEAHFHQMTAQRDADRKDLDVANRVDVAQREMKLLEEAPKDVEQTRAIVSP